MIIEGVAFDIFGLSEDVARQVSSTVLAVFTFAVASSVTIGGIIYDASGWKGMSVFHTICQVVVLLLFVSQPAVLSSFWEVFGREEITEEMETDPVVPAPGAAALQKHDLQLEDIDEMEEDENADNSGRMTTANKKTDASVRERETVASVAILGRKTQDSGTSRGRASQDSGGSRGRKTQDSHGSRGRKTQEGTRNTTQTRARGSTHTARTNNTHKTQMTHGTVLTGKSALTVRTAITARTQMTSGTQATVLSRITSLVSLKDSDTFQHHFAANSNLRETIAQRRGLRAPAESDDEEEEEEKSTSVPKDLRFPLLLCVMCCFNNTGSYVIEFGTFAIFFKDYHGWESATWASLAQTAGDLVAAVMMKVLRSDVEEAENVSCLRRMILQPYNIACLLFGWVLCNLGMVSPLLPIAVTAQIIMGTLYVYTIKMTTDLNLFYSMGDTALFVKLQGFCKNAEALGGGIASWIGPFLYATVNPFFPFIVSTCMSLLAFLLFTAGFGHRVGCLDIDSAEEQRSQRLGKKRVSRWSVASRKSTVVMPEIELEES